MQNVVLTKQRHIKYLSKGISYLHSFVDHFTQIQTFIRQLSPASVQNNFKDGSHQPPGGLQRRKKNYLTLAIGPAKAPAQNSTVCRKQ